MNGKVARLIRHQTPTEPRETFKKRYRRAKKEYRRK